MGLGIGDSSNNTVPFNIVFQAPVASQSASMSITPASDSQNRAYEPQASAHVLSAPQESLGELPRRPSLPNVSANDYSARASGLGDAEPRDELLQYSTLHQDTEGNASKRDTFESPAKKRRRLCEEGEYYQKQIQSSQLDDDGNLIFEARTVDEYGNVVPERDESDGSTTVDPNDVEQSKTYPEQGVHFETSCKECEVPPERFDDDAMMEMNEGGKYPSEHLKAGSGNDNTSAAAESHRRSSEYAHLGNRNSAAIDGDDNTNANFNNRHPAGEQQRDVRLSCNLFRPQRVRNEKNLESSGNREQEAPTTDEIRTRRDFSTDGVTPAVCTNESSNLPKGPSGTLRSRPAFPSNELILEDNLDGEDAVGNENVHSNVRRIPVNSCERAPMPKKVEQEKSKKTEEPCQERIKRKAERVGAQNGRNEQRTARSPSNVVENPSPVKRTSKKKGESTEIITDQILSSRLHPRLLGDTTFRAPLHSSFKVKSARDLIETQFELRLSQLTEKLKQDRSACPLPTLHLCASVETVARSCGSVLIVNAWYVDRKWNLRKLLLGLQPIKNRDINAALTKVLNEHKLVQQKHIAGVTINGELRKRLFGEPLIPGIPQDQCVDDGLCTALWSAFASRGDDFGYNAKKISAFSALNIAVELAGNKNFASGENKIDEGLIRDAECCISGLRGPHWGSLPAFLCAAS